MIWPIKTMTNDEVKEEYVKNEVKKISVYNAETDQTEEYEFIVDSDGNLAPLDATDEKKAPAKPKSKIVLGMPKKLFL